MLRAFQAVSAGHTCKQSAKRKGKQTVPARTRIFCISPRAESLLTMLRLTPSSLSSLCSSWMWQRSLYTRTHLGIETLLQRRRSALASLAEERLDARRRHLRRLQSSQQLLSSEVRQLIDTSETRQELAESGHVVSQYIEQSTMLTSETRMTNAGFLLSRFFKLCHHLDGLDEALQLWKSAPVQQLVLEGSPESLWLETTTCVLADLCYERGMHAEVLNIHDSLQNRAPFRDLSRLCAAACLRIGDKEALGKTGDLLQTARSSNAEFSSARFYACVYALLAARQGDYFTALEELASVRIDFALRVNLQVFFLARTGRYEEALMAMRNSVRRRSGENGSSGRTFSSLTARDLRYCSESVQALADAVNASEEPSLKKALESVFAEMDANAKISEQSLEDLVIGSNWGKRDSKPLVSTRRREDVSADRMDFEDEGLDESEIDAPTKIN